MPVGSNRGKDIVEGFVLNVQLLFILVSLVNLQYTIIQVCLFSCMYAVFCTFALSSLSGFGGDFVFGDKETRGFS